MFRSHPRAHHQELTTALTASGFTLECGGSSVVGCGLASQNTLSVPSSYLPAYEDGTDGVFRHVGMWNSDAGELPRIKHTIFRTWRNFEIKKSYHVLVMLIASWGEYVCIVVEEFMFTGRFHCFVLELTYYSVYSNTILLTLRRLMSYIYGAPILDVSRSHTTTQHSR